jgi:amino acid adenylation domain-containing protein
MVALYTAFARGEPSPLPAPSIQYADFAAWQRGWMDTPEAREQLEWWRRWLEGVPPVLELPSDRPRPAAMSFRGSGLRLSLRPDLFERADAFSRARGVTLYMTLLAAFQALLHRYTGETDFCVGSGVADRRTREAEELIGMVVNTLPLRADVAGDPAFGALVDRVRDAAMGAYARQDVPFAEIVNAVHPERSRGHLPVFQVAFSFHHAPYPEMRLPGATIEVAEGLGNESAKFDLNIIVIPRAQQGSGDEVVMIWEWAEDLFDRETVRRMVAHYEEILSGALKDPSTPVSRLPMVPEDEARAVAAWGAAPAPYPRDATVHALFAGQARRTPHAVAVTHGARRMTYAELNASSARVARRLRALGIGAESAVAVAMDRSPETIAAFLGALRAGGACLPIDIAYPADRLAFMLEDAGAAALIVSADVPEPLRTFAGPIISLADLASGEDRSMWDDREMEDGREMAVAESAACVIYTSGSTGRPKGVVVPHRGIVRLVRGGGATQVMADDVVAQGSTVSFDAALWEVWGALLNGARLAIVDREEMLSPHALAARLREDGVTAIFLTTALFNQLSAETPDALSGLRLLVTGGESADPAAFRRVLEMGSDAPRLLVNAYGPTEGTTYSTEHAAASADAAAVPIGRPVPNTRVHVLDGEMHPVPPGVPGELYVGGDGVARGYLARPALTAERFVPDPVSGEPGARLYRTGDRVRWRADGALEFVGRVDDQVKVRGFRVEPGEIEAALRAHPGVADAAVAARPDADGVLSLAAYVVPREDDAPDAAALRAFLSTRLPPYMVPSAYAVLDSLPLTPSGKVDRRRLPDPGAALAGDAPAEPETATEAALLDIWREVLELERVGAEDNFFDLGGHSLRATRIVSRVEARMGVRIPVGSIFDHPTVRSLARLVEERAPAAPQGDDLLAWIEGLSDEEAERLLADGR